MSTLDRQALRQGASVALVFAVPFSVASRFVADHTPGSPWASVLWLAALGGFTLGAGIAAWTQSRGLPLVHGMVCAAATYAAAQAVFVVFKLVRGGDVRWLGIFFTFTAVLFAGLVGGGLGSLLRKRGLVPRGGRPE
jgi:hypothetical protein